MTTISVREMASAAIRIWALMLIFDGIRFGGMALPGAFAAEEPQSIMLVIYSTAYLAIHVLAGLFLLLRTSKVVGWILPPRPGDDGVPLGGNSELLIIGFSLLGAYFFVSGLEQLVSKGPNLYYLLARRDGMARFDWFDAVPSLFRTVAGLVLFLAPNSLLEYIRRVGSRVRVDEE